MYICICMYVCIYVHIYIYIYIEREREIHVLTPSLPMKDTAKLPKVIGSRPARAARLASAYESDEQQW